MLHGSASHRIIDTITVWECKHIRPLWMEDAAAAPHASMHVAVGCGWHTGQADGLSAAPFSSTLRDNLPFDSSLDAVHIALTHPQHSHYILLAHESTAMHVLCPSLLCLPAGPDCYNSSAAPEARKSAPVDSRHVLHTHFCLISLLCPCCKNYGACCFHLMCCNNWSACKHWNKTLIIIIMIPVYLILSIMPGCSMCNIMDADIPREPCLHHSFPLFSPHPWL